MTIM